MAATIYIRSATHSVCIYATCMMDAYFKAATLFSRPRWIGAVTDQFNTSNTAVVGQDDMIQVLVYYGHRQPPVSYIMAPVPVLSWKTVSTHEAFLERIKEVHLTKQVRLSKPVRV